MVPIQRLPTETTTIIVLLNLIYPPLNGVSGIIFLYKTEQICKHYAVDIRQWYLPLYYFSVSPPRPKVDPRCHTAAASQDQTAERPKCSVVHNWCTLLRNNININFISIVFASLPQNHRGMHRKVDYRYAT